MLMIRGLAAWRERLEQVRADAVMAAALAEQADKMAEAVRAGLLNTLGTADHERPWEQTGALRESVGSVTEGMSAAVGSSDAAAAPQELGTATIPARPFLAPVAAGMGEGVAQAIGAVMAGALDGRQSGQAPAQITVASSGQQSSAASK